MRTIVIIFYVLYKTGIEQFILCQWFPSSENVYYQFRKLKQKGLWSQALDVINKIHRTKKDRNETQGYGWDWFTERVKTVFASEERGIDGNKKIKGRKRHIEGRYFR